jgi:hypothetical protein
MGDAVVIVGLLIGSVFFVVTAFVFSFSVMRLTSEQVWCPWYVQVIAIVWLVVGTVADAVFNVLWGSVIFLELPHELLFTDRVQRHYARTNGDWRHAKAAQWREFLNAVDPGHV